MTWRQYISLRYNLQALGLLILWCCLPICFVCFRHILVSFTASAEHCHFDNTCPTICSDDSHYVQMILTMFLSYQGHILLFSWVRYVWSLVITFLECWNDHTTRKCKQHRRKSACASAQSDPRICVHCLDSIVHVLAKSKISRLKLASVVVQAGLSLTWSQTPKIGFLVTWLRWFCNEPECFPNIQKRMRYCLQYSIAAVPTPLISVSMLTFIPRKS